MIIIIALRGAIPDFLQSSHCAANFLQHVRSSGQGAIVCKSHATHRAFITCFTSCATWYEGAAQLLSLTELNPISFSFILLVETISRRRRGGNQSTRRKPLMTSLRKCHILKPENLSPSRDWNPHSSTGDRLGKQTC